MDELDALVSFWREGAAERERLIARAHRHGVGTVQYRRWMRRDHRVGGMLLDVGDELQRRGVDPRSLR